MFPRLGNVLVERRRESGNNHGRFTAQTSGLLLDFAPYPLARHLSLLDATHRRAVDWPPVSKQLQRQFFTTLPNWATQFLATYSQTTQKA